MAVYLFCDIGKRCMAAAYLKETAEFYEEIARQYLNNDSMKCGVERCFLNAGICELCQVGLSAITNALERYQELDPTFLGTAEYRFLVDIAAVVDEEDIGKFTAVVKESGRIFGRSLETSSWKTTLHMRVKKTMKAKELEEDDLT